MFFDVLFFSARYFLEHFLKHCMPLMDRRFGTNRSKCLQTLKDMQQCTRYLQHICSHTKTKKDISLSAHVPLLKKALETFVFRVKSMLALNDATSGFMIGELKNRKLDGEVIVEDSQQSGSREQEDEEEEEDEDLPEEDQSDVDLDEDRGPKEDGKRILGAVEQEEEEESMEF